MSWWQVVKSVAASAFGVQSEKNRQQDFQHHSPVPYIVVGIIFVLVLILSLLTLTRWIVG